MHANIRTLLSFRAGRYSLLIYAPNLNNANRYSPVTVRYVILIQQENDNEKERKDRICKELAIVIKEVIVTYHSKFVSVFNGGSSKTTRTLSPSVYCHNFYIIEFYVSF